MPQIWLTYDELATLIECDRTAARAAAISMGLDRRKSRDGMTRAKLSPLLAEAFFDHMMVAGLEQQATYLAGDLRVVHQRMTEQSTAADLPRNRATTHG